MAIADLTGALRLRNGQFRAALDATTAATGVTDDIVPRPRLERRLVEAASQNLITTLVGPEGTGKTTALAAIEREIRRLGQPVVVLRCSAADADPGHFAATLERAVLQAGGARAADPDHLLTTLLDLAAARGPVTFIVDDFDAADHKPQRALVVNLLHGGRGEIRVAVATRRRLRCGLGSPMLDSKLADFGMDALAFTRDEAANLFPPPLSAQDEQGLQLLLDRTAGWPLALRMALRRHRAGESLAAIAAGLSGASPEFAGLFSSTFEDLPPTQRAALTVLGPIGQAPTELIAEVLDSGSVETLEALAESCPFVSFDGRDGQELHLHPLFRDYLLARLRREQPLRCQQVLERAALWFERREAWLAAAGCWLRAGQTERAAPLIDRASRQRHLTQPVPLSGEELPLAVTLTPESAFRVGRGRAFQGAMADTARLLEHAPSLVTMNGDDKARMQLLRLLVAFGYDEFDLVRTEAGRWLSDYRSARTIDRVIAALALALACNGLLDPVKANVALDQARSDATRSDSAYLHTWIAIVAGLLALDGGNPVLALAEMERALAHTGCQGAVRRTCELVRAECLYETGQSQAAAQILERHLVEGLRHGVTETAMAGLETAIRLRELDAGVGAALTLSREAEHTIERRFGNRARNHLRLARIEAVLRQPDDRRALQFDSELTELDILADGDARHAPATEERLRLAIARRHIAEGDSRGGLALLAPILSQSLTSRRLRTWARASVLKTAAQIDEGDLPAALKTLWAAIERTAPRGLYRSFLDDAALLRPLAPALLDHARRLGSRGDQACLHLAEAIAKACAVPDQATVPAAPLSDMPVEALTSGEIKVLSLAASGLKNAEIAEHMLVAVPTVKWHLHNIFGKLGVRTRTAAIAKARETGVLS